MDTDAKACNHSRSSADLGSYYSLKCSNSLSICVKRKKKRKFFEDLGQNNVVERHCRDLSRITYLTVSTSKLPPSDLHRSPFGKQSSQGRNIAKYTTHTAPNAWSRQAEGESVLPSRSFQTLERPLGHDPPGTDMRHNHILHQV